MDGHGGRMGLVKKECSHCEYEGTLDCSVILILLFYSAAVQ